MQERGDRPSLGEGAGEGRQAFLRGGSRRGETGLPWGREQERGDRPSLGEGAGEWRQAFLKGGSRRGETGLP